MITLIIVPLFILTIPAICLSPLYAVPFGALFVVFANGG